MTSFVVRSGLTARLVEAADATEALERALSLIPRGAMLAGREDVTVRPATAIDLADFAAATRRRRNRPRTAVLPMDLPPARRKSRANRGEHA